MEIVGGSAPRPSAGAVRVFVAGASGAIGEPLIAELVKRGHSVMGMTTSETRAKVLEGQGASDGWSGCRVSDLGSRRGVGKEETILVHRVCRLLLICRLL
jgi:nucleoside-diphosphate-sugar epimerase